MKKQLVLAITLAALAVLAPLAAQPAPFLPVGVTPSDLRAGAELQSFRQDLHEYVAELRSLPPTLLEAIYDDHASLATADERIAAMTAAELRSLKEALDRIPYWRSVPAVFASAVPPGSVAREADLGTALARSGQGDPEAFRHRWMTLLDRMEDIPPELVSPGFHGNVAVLRTEIAALGPDELQQLQQAILARLPAWREMLRTAREGGDPGELRSVTAAACGSSLSGIICRIEEAIADLIDLGDHIVSAAADAVTAIFDDLVGLFGDLVEALPSDPAALVAAMGIDLNDPEWFQSIVSNVPVLRPPCPEDNPVLVSLIGNMGTTEAAYTCKRGIQWVAKAIYDNAPDDIWGMPFKVPFAFVYYPIDYLCMCYEEAWQVTFDDRQADHRTLVDANLDVDVSTRASQLSLNGASAQVADLDGDVAAVETKLDILEAKADDLLDGEEGQTDFLLDFQALALRMRIEANLFREGNDRISLFQLPEAVGGVLETVREVVADTIQTRIEAGIGIGRAEAELANGDAAYGAGSFKDAYGHYRKAYREATRG